MMIWRKKVGPSKLRIDRAARPERNNKAPFVQRRATRALRRKVWLPCQLIWGKNEVTRAICLDVSTSGARVRSFTSPSVSANLRFRCPGLGLDEKAVLVRQDGPDMAIAFLEETRPASENE